MKNNPNKKTISKKNNKTPLESSDVIKNETNDAEELDFNDEFGLDTGGLFEQKDIARIDLPKFILSNNIKNSPSVNEKSPVMLTLFANKSNPNVGSKVFSAIKKGFSKFIILFPDEENNVSCKWVLENAKIKAVDFGHLDPNFREEPRFIECEIEYDNLVIDNEVLY